jgi:uncharacterized membrane protein YjdF
MSDTARPDPTRITALITMLLRLALIAAAILSGMTANWSALFASVGTIGLTYAPQVLAHQLNVRIPLLFELIITIFLYASIFLGEVGNYYERFWWWDSVLHIGSAFAFGFAGFLVLFLLFMKNKVKASPFLVAVFSFTFGLAIGAMWEIFEFMVDSLFGTNMQKSGLRDTMGDLIVDAFGAGLASVIGYIYLRFKIRDPFDALINLFLQANPRFRTRFPGRLRR